ncbi:signal peptide-containing protein [Theileria equi strain WA]|uniref:Signal peptide-containing protein n=1 Tax=Theileria equi strain WA TaxID=1537102 RepID=L0AZQ6_THEEQ|nr:signal peptide-containing protein [Theileria equi strain WA]AFZ80369.1 signal peptide-containing protein [Theileria equi strain WA]|eukprot:XP_004830035.1 signal peptide-containing protein [Theileria equi strain WA]
MRSTFFFLFFIGSALSHRLRSNVLAPSLYTSFSQKTYVDRISKIIRNDLDSKVDEIVDILASDLEKELGKNGLLAASYLETVSGNGWAKQAKVIVKKTLLSIIKRMIPLFDMWIHDAVQPPVVDRLVYKLLVHPLGFGISEELRNKLHITTENPWKEDAIDDDDDDFDTLGADEDEEDEDLDFS